MEALPMKFKKDRGEKSSQCVKCSAKVKKSKSGFCKKCIHIKRYRPGDVINDISFVYEIGIINHRAYWMFECFCGNYFSSSTTSIKSGHTRSCGCMAIEVLVKRNHFRSGENHPRWIKDRTLLCEHQRNLHGSFKNFAKKYKAEKNYTCEVTGKGGELDLHHITAVCVNPDLALTESNVILITRELHKKFHSQYGYQVTDVEWVKFVVENNLCYNRDR